MSKSANHPIQIEVQRESDHVIEESQMESDGAKPVALPLTEYYNQKYGQSNVQADAFGTSEGENKYMLQAQQLMQSRHTDLQRS